MPRRVSLLTLGLLTVGLAIIGTGAWSKPAAAPVAQGKGEQSHAEDRTAIAAVMQSFVKAFEHKDAKGLASHFTTHGEYSNENGKSASGREALEKGFAKFFAKSAELKADVRPESLRFLSNDAAIEEGAVTVRRGGNASGDAHYCALFVREQGKWFIAQLTESGHGSDSIADLSWLVGEWKSISGQGAEIKTAYSLDTNKKFIHVQFQIAEKAMSYAGFQVIGVDPAVGNIRTWTFEADGGVGVADWNRDGDHWELKLVGTLADGRRISETNILRRVNSDTITWQSINRSIAGVEIPDLPPVKATRVNPSK